MLSNSAYITGLNIRSLGSIQMYAVNFLPLSLKGDLGKTFTTTLGPVHAQRHVCGGQLQD